MSSDWAAADDLMRELGSIRQAAATMQGSGLAKAAIERAIGEAAEAVTRTIDGPRNPEALMAARDALGVAEEVILALDAEIGRSLRARKRGSRGSMAGSAHGATPAGSPRPARGRLLG